MMKRRKEGWLRLAMALVILSLTASPALAADPSVVFGSATAAPGDTVTISISVKDLPAAADTAQINVGYDAAVLTHNKATSKAEGTWVLPSINDVTPATAPHSGEISVMLVGGTMPAGTETKIATLSFTVKATAAEADYTVAYIEKTGDTGIVSGGSFVQNLLKVNGKVTVTKPKNPPVASNGTLELEEDAAEKTGTLTATDPDGDTLTYTIVAQAAKGTVTLTDKGPNYKYVPNANASGNDTFTFQASDGTGAAPSTVATVTVTIAAKEDLPVAAAGTLAVNEDAAKTPSKLVAEDADKDPLVYTIVGQPAKGKVTITNAATGDYEYTPTANLSGTDTFTFKVNDGKADSTVATVTVTIAPQPDKPVAEAAAFTVKIGAEATGILKATDADNDPLIFSVVTQPTKGTLTVTGTTGAYKYTPKADATAGTDTFTFKANDGSLDSDLATGTVTIEKATHTITLTMVTTPTATVPGGTITPAGTDGKFEVQDGLDAPFTVKANTGYKVSEVKMDGIATVPQATGIYTFPKVVADHTLAVTFIPATMYKVTASATPKDGGTIASVPAGVAGVTEVADGGSVTYTLTITKDWQINKVTVGGVVKEVTGTTFTVADIKADTAVVVTFKRIGTFSSADTSYDLDINLTELLRVSSLYNAGSYSCKPGTEDGFAPGAAGDRTCTPHTSDYKNDATGSTQNWKIELSEFLRVIQFYNVGGYVVKAGTEDGFAPSATK